MNVRICHRNIFIDKFPQPPCYRRPQYVVFVTTIPKFHFIHSATSKNPVCIFIASKMGTLGKRALNSISCLPTVTFEVAIGILPTFPKVFPSLPSQL